MTKTLSFSALIFLCFALFEAAVLSNFTLLPCIPDFLLITLIFLSVNNGRLFGSIAGFIAGLFLDFLTASPFGFHCLYMTILGYVFGFLNKAINISGFFFPVLMGFSSSFLKGFILLLISILYPHISISDSIFSFRFLIEIVFNTVLTPFVYRFLGFFKNSILLSPEKVA